MNECTLDFSLLWDSTKLFISLVTASTKYSLTPPHTLTLFRNEPQDWAQDQMQGSEAEIRDAPIIGTLNWTLSKYSTTASQHFHGGREAKILLILSSQLEQRVHFVQQPVIKNTPMPLCTTAVQLHTLHTCYQVVKCGLYLSTAFCTL